MVPPKNINGFLTLYNKYRGFKIGIDRNFCFTRHIENDMIKMNAKIRKSEENI